MWGEPAVIVGDFNIEPTTHCSLLARILAGLWVDLETPWAAARDVHQSVTCKRSLDSLGGTG